MENVSQEKNSPSSCTAHGLQEQKQPQNSPHIRQTAVGATFTTERVCTYLTVKHNGQVSLHLLAVWRVAIYKKITKIRHFTTKNKQQKIISTYVTLNW